MGQRGGLFCATLCLPSEPAPPSPARRPPLFSQSYVGERLRRWDARYAASCFDLLVHVTACLQAPARREATRAAYSEVAALFAAAAAAEAQGTAHAPAALVAATPGAAAAASEGDGERVRLRLACSGDSVEARLLKSAASHGSGGSGGGLPDLQWRLQLVPRPDGQGMAAMLAPAEPEPAGAAAAAAAASSGRGGGGAGISEAAVSAVVAAARFMHHQLNELKADVAAARLSLLKGAPGSWEEDGPLIDFPSSGAQPSTHRLCSPPCCQPLVLLQRPSWAAAPA